MNTAKPIIMKKHWLSGIWLLPLVAALVGGWMLYQNMLEKGVEISIIFNDAAGIKEGKTQIIYKGVRVGLVKTVHISPNLQQVKVMAEIQRSAEMALKTTAKFWLVKPKVSITEITGLDTIVSGNYIAFLPGKGRLQSEFVASDKPPILENDPQGLYINIVADHLGSISRGAKIYFREIPVGEVLDYELADSQKGVIIKARIDERYTYLIKKSSRFWNASGLSIKAGLSGFSIQTESLAALLAGGIAFYTPDTASIDTIKNGEQFKLYSDFDSAKVGILVKISFETAVGLEEGVTEVKYDAFKIGIVKKLSYTKRGKRVIADVIFDPRAAELLKTETQFWLDKPKLSLTDFSGLSSLLQGNHIKMQAGSGEDKRDFVALSKPPIMSAGDKSLHLILKADNLGALEYASPVLYKKVQVGQVHDFRLDKQGEYVLIDIYIMERYVHLVSEYSHFWNSSGVDVSLGTQGLAIKTGTMSSMLKGGIAFMTPKKSSKKIHNHTLYPLYSRFSEAKEAGEMGYKLAKGEQQVRLITHELGSIEIGSHVYFKKIPVGKVVHYALSDKGETIIITLSIQKKYKHLLGANTHFWRNSGLKIKAGLSGVSVDMASINSLLNGGISFVNIKTETVNAKEKTDLAPYRLYDDKNQATETATQIKIHIELAKGIAVGTAIKYLGMDVGEVTHVELSPDNKFIIASAKLVGSAAKFARQGTQFWLISARLGLFKNKNLETLIKGNYLEIEPGIGAKQLEFTAKLETPEIKHGLHLVLKASRLGSISKGNPVYYRQMTVGEVHGFRLANNATHVLIDIYIAPQYVTLVKTNTRFWNASGVKMDFGLFSGAEVRTESVESIVSGGISFATPEESTINAINGQIFELNTDFDVDWLKWKPEIALLE